VSDVSLRGVTPSDRDVFFAMEQDTIAIDMAAFTAEDPTDRTTFDAHWDRILASDSVTMRTVLGGGEVAGTVGSYVMDGDREVTYWIGRPHWGQGIATDALRLFLAIDSTRPMHARVAADNTGSIRVLRKCGFTITEETTGFAHGRGEIIAEHVMTLEM